MLRSDTRYRLLLTNLLSNRISLSNGICATSRYLHIVGSIHDIESYLGIDNASSLNTQLFLSHWGHLSILFFWLSGNLFHIGWNGNYELWTLNPIATIPIAHGLWDPHLSLSICDAYSSGRSDYCVVVSYSGIYNWLYTAGFNSVFQVYNTVIVLELLAVVTILLGKVHLIYLEDTLQWYWRHQGFVFNVVQKITNLYNNVALDSNGSRMVTMLAWPSRLFMVCFDSANLRLNYHLGTLIGCMSIGWCGHLVHVSIPMSRGSNMYPMLSLYPLYSGHWPRYSLDLDSQAILTFIGGLKSNTASIYLTDIAHHHLAVGILFVWPGHVYLSVYKGLGHRIRDVFFVNGNAGLTIPLLGKSVDLQLSLALGGPCVITSLAAQHIYSLSPYPYLLYDCVIYVAIFVHHSWIASLLMTGCFSHASIFLIRDYSSACNRQDHDVISRSIGHKAAIISHLSWISLWLGFHLLGIFIHNDSVVAFGEQEKQILIEPVFGQLIQEYACQSFDSFIMPLSCGDLLAHHAIALGLHVTILILLKGSLD